MKHSDDILFDYLNDDIQFREFNIQHVEIIQKVSLSDCLVTIQ